MAPASGELSRRSSGQGGGTSSISAPLRSAQVAQLVEQRTENPCVGGSIPPLGTSIPAIFGTNDSALDACCAGVRHSPSRSAVPRAASYVALFSSPHQE